jgi:tRNA threonylcarbamoyladenosine biosynthesis protein TsaE
MPTFAIANEQEMQALGARLAGHTAPGILVYVSGVLGAGKTTFVRGFLRALGHLGPVKSPTFTMVESYDLPGRQVHHFDLYRLSDPEELYFLGFEDYLDAGADCFVEWPQRARDYLPAPDLDIDIEIVQGGRRLRCAARTESGLDALVVLNEKYLKTDS